MFVKQELIKLLLVLLEHLQHLALLHHRNLGLVFLVMVINEYMYLLQHLVTQQIGRMNKLLFMIVKELLVDKLLR